ncbi:hypothetical protein METBIDRAFT_167410 [Metschnikowia bicuspidata var. bicuspidata NRRL YB-4993]|uniref:Uncharacterized protein n=1 Tax=Metschnikowia bicuspidata var. bicuspidata NRRL YB-4993 TaxID=869754 RepID=A0A1A0HAN4_9ASCO|nr:hypothetical protein METBIDRAFT_167410 [Metschnikowia bicuspidata var. bicuspidata NRRL YB-4993]OBA20937.1 hypothetical protein METBIDRAFT_167410 [Metschnikowia bicuspidata var. bicuspidata NRRL YB-4993]
MNRKRKSTDILAQLGEPLPLPYQANPHTIKSERSFEDSPPVPQPLAYGRIRKRRVSERRELLGLRNEEFNGPNLDEHVPLPIWRRDRGSFSTGSHPETEIEEDIEQSVKTPSVLDELQQQLDLLKSMYDSKDALDADHRKFANVSASLQQIIEQKQQESIVHELERIQKQNKGLRSHQGVNSKWKAGLWLLAFLLLLLASFVAGQFSYEYCYYFC